MIGSSITHSPSTTQDGMRPINLRTDLAQLADLIELVFANSMDSNGRAALREMRYLSKMGPGLHVISRMNDLALGVSMGYVWIENGKLVGNVSIYPANLPPDMGSAYIIANVGTHPDYQRRGIARRLMEASLAMIKHRKGRMAILQVDATNYGAQNLYRSLGFIEERAWTTWRRHGSGRVPPLLEDKNLYIRHRRRSEWQQEMALAERVRPPAHGGIGWLRPLHRHWFNTPFWKTIGDWINLRSVERLVIQPDEGQPLRAVLWIENNIGSKAKLTLMVDPLAQGLYDDALLHNVVQRFGRTSLVIEHPDDEVAVGRMLSRYGFIPQRTVLHMRWNVY